MTPETARNTPWLADLALVPTDAAWPLWMGPVHPDAIGSYGEAFEAWCAEELGVTLRWWQRLCARRILEYDAWGVLVWRQVIESTPRRAGKSTLARCLILWRMANADLWGVVQSIVHSGSDLLVCRELQRHSWRWAAANGWGVTKGNGKESVEAPDGSRWLVRSQEAAGYSLDVDLGLVDEAWNVSPATVDEGLEPALADRPSAQLLLTSTAHRKATSLMRRRLASAMTDERYKSLLLYWGAPLDADISDPETWRLASPHWSEARLDLVRDRYERAMRGEGDPELDDPDPIEGLRCQYMNIWSDPSAPRLQPGEVVVTEAEWEAFNGFHPDGQRPDVVGVEAWYADGVCVASGYRQPEGTVGLSVQGFPDLASAGRHVRGLAAPLVLVGKSLQADPAFAGLAVQPVGGTTLTAVKDLRRYLDDKALRHDGSPVLTQQVLALRTQPSTDGVRLISKTRADAVKACAFVLEQARQAAETPRIF